MPKPKAKAKTQKVKPRPRKAPRRIGRSTVTEANKVTQRIRGSEMLMDVHANIGGFLDAMPLAPSLWDKSRIHVLAQAYSLYAINSMRFTYVPTCETTSAGTVFFGIQTMNSLNISKNALMSSALGDGGGLTKTYSKFGSKKVFDDMKTTTFFPMVDSAEQKVSPPVFLVLTENNSEETVKVGYISVDYDFTFTTPVLKVTPMSTLRVELSYAKYLPSGFSAIVIGDLRKGAVREQYERIIFDRETGFLSNLFKIGKKILSYVDVSGLTTLVVDGIHGLLTPSKLALLDTMNSDDDVDILAMVNAPASTDPDEPTNPYIFTVEAKMKGFTNFEDLKWDLLTSSRNVTKALVLPNTGTPENPVYSQMDLINLEPGRVTSVGAKSLIAASDFEELRIFTTSFQPQMSHMLRGISTISSFGDVLQRVPLLYRKMEQYFEPYVDISPHKGPLPVSYQTVTRISDVVLDADRTIIHPGDLGLVFEDGEYVLKYVEGTQEGLELVFIDGFSLPTVTQGVHLHVDLNLDQQDAEAFWEQYFSNAPPPPTPTPPPSTPTPPQFALLTEDGVPVTPSAYDSSKMTEWFLYTRSQDNVVVIGDWNAVTDYAASAEPMYNLGSSLDVRFSPKTRAESQLGCVVEVSDAWLLQHGTDLAAYYAGLDHGQG